MTRLIFRRIVCMLLCSVLLSGCAQPLFGPPVPYEPETEPTTETTLPPPTAPANGNPDDVTCLGSYDGQIPVNTPVAKIGETVLTAGVLQMLYGLEVNSYRLSGATPAPDWDIALDCQECPLEGTAITWQQHFLARALSRWHTCMALVLTSQTAQMPIHPEHMPTEYNYKTYLKPDMPVMQNLYGYDPSYKLNTLVADYISSIPQLLEEMGGADTLAASLGGSQYGQQLVDTATLLNQGYDYFLFARYFYAPTEEEIEAAGGQSNGSVTFRHVLFTGAEAQDQADAFLKEYSTNRKKNTEGKFATLANEQSQDEGSKLDGGLYTGVTPGQFPAEIDSWLFDEARVTGDTVILKTSLGVHVLYFREVQTAQEAGKELLTEKFGQELLTKVRADFPMEVDYSAIRLGKPSMESKLTIDNLLYADIAHEFITDVPTYLQQDYPKSNYGAFPLASWGCGITTLAMLATYMTDTWITPPELADRYGSYCHQSGTDAMLVEESAPELGYYVKNYGYDWRVANQYMETDGSLVVCLQHKGYFTRGGHYLILHSLNEDGTVAIRDSNIFNYGKLMPHKDNRFSWNNIIASGVAYWVFQDKVVRIPACFRCGEETGFSAPEGLLQTDYTCHKCADALQRRTQFLELSAPVE